VFDPGEGIGFGVNGGFGFTSRTLDDADVDVAEGLFDVNGGIIVADLLYVSLGLQFLNQTEDVFDSTTTYVTVPLGIGVLKGSDAGYLLAQLRFGGGSAENDQASGSEDIGYFGLRVMGQTGTADGLQFMGGLEFDAYGADDADNTTDNFFRFFFGLGFGG
jgi:hypothetical protein